MFTSSNVIISMWLIPVVLEIVLPLTMLAGLAVAKLIRNSIPIQKNEEVEAIYHQAAFSN